MSATFADEACSRRWNSCAIANSPPPFPADARLHAHVKREAMMRGLMCYPMGGTVDGANGDHVLLAPPFIVIDAHIDEIADKLAAAVDAAIDAAG
jgi:adenosylmethionine-8-amino-7-oxononanoate aminotransferase